MENKFLCVLFLAFCKIKKEVKVGIEVNLRKKNILHTAILKKKNTQHVLKINIKQNRKKINVGIQFNGTWHYQKQVHFCGNKQI